MIIPPTVPIPPIQSNRTFLLMQVLSVQDGDARDDGLVPNVDLSKLKSKDLDALAAVFQRWIQERLIYKLEDK